MKFPSYPKYKDSGVEWLGEVPEHWGVKRLKDVSMVRYGLSEPPEYCDDGLAFIRATDIYRGKISLDAVRRVSPDAVLWNRRPQLNEGEIIIVRSGAYTGDSAIVSQEVSGSIVGFDMVMTIHKATPKFIAWILLSKYMLDGQIYLSRMRAAQPHLNAEELGCFIAVMPPLPEQRAIAAFLDAQTSKIDTLIAKKRELIDKLKEKRAALITRTVTRGLPPEAAKAAGLDPNPRMKDSGVEWLGEVPEHWEVKRLRFAVNKIEQGWSPQCHSCKAENGEWGVLKVGCVNGLQFNPDENKALPEELEPKTEYLIEENDILMSRANTRELLGSAALVEKLPETKLLLCDKLYRIKVGQELVPAFLVHLMCTPLARFHFEREATGTSGSMQNIGQDTVKDLPVFIPSYDEQTAILDYIREASTRLTAIIERTQTAITILQEYRSALITAAVTGKIDVHPSWR